MFEDDETKRQKHQNPTERLGTGPEAYPNGDSKVYQRRWNSVPGPPNCIIAKSLIDIKRKDRELDSAKDRNARQNVEIRLDELEAQASREPHQRHIGNREPSPISKYKNKHKNAQTWKEIK